MTIKYALPCRCGRVWEVENRQAGEQIVCSCGRKVDVPTLRGLAELKQVERPDAPRSRWTRTQGICFLAGVVWLAVGVGVTWWLWSVAQQKPPVVLYDKEAEDLSDRLESLTPAESLIYWRMFRDEPGRMFNAKRRPQVDDAKTRRYQKLAVAAGAVTLLGAFAFGLVIFTSQKKQT